MSLVSKDSDGFFTIGPLTGVQYAAINDSLELAAAWTDREVDKRIAAALRKLLTQSDLESGTNNASSLFDKLPDPGSDEIDCPHE